jgi:type I restriction enzyme S subunit
MVKEGYKQTEIGVIPEDWEVKQIGNSFIFKNGLNKAKKYFGEGKPIINYMDVFKNCGIYKKDIFGKVQVNKEEIKNYNVKRGDVFFTRTSETIDEIGLTAVIMEDIENAVFSGFVLRARPIDNSYILEYKKYCFSSKYIRNQIISTSSYTTRALTNGTFLSKVYIPVPPKPEQKAISTALSDIDHLINSLEQLIAKKEAIKKATMQQLLTGKKRLKGFSGEWEEKKLGEVVKVQNGYAFKSYLFIQEGIPIVRISNIADNYIDFYDVVYYPEIKIDKNYIIEKDDVLIAMSGATTGKVGKYTYEKKAYLNQRVGKFIVNKKYITLGYVSYFLKTKIFKKQLIEYIAQGAQPNISTKEIESIYIKYPQDIQEQKAIAKILSDMDKEIEVLKSKLDKLKAIKTGMMQELLTGRVRLIK